MLPLRVVMRTGREDTFGLRSDLVVPLDAVVQASLIERWRWLCAEPLRAWFATALGDLFLQDAAGQVLWLDVGSAELHPVARDEADFRERVRDPENAGLWFGQRLVDALRASGAQLQPGEVYSYKVAPILGGAYAPENFRAQDVVSHFRTWGPIHEALKDVPDGTSVVFRAD